MFVIVANWQQVSTLSDHILERGPCRCGGANLRIRETFNRGQSKVGICSQVSIVPEKVRRLNTARCIEVELKLIEVQGDLFHPAPLYGKL